MRGIIRGTASAWLLSAVLTAGCSGGAPASYQATTGTCYAFGVQALRRHVTVITVPRACAGLSRAQVNLAVARAVREAAGSGPKAIARRLAQEESDYLAYLIRNVSPPQPLPPAAAPARQSPARQSPARQSPARQSPARQSPARQSPARPSSDLPLSLVALAAWMVTAAAGSYLLTGWLAHGGLRRGITRAAGMPPAIIVSHFALAVAGLGIWIAFVATEAPFLAWIAVGLILPIAGLGLAALAAALPEPAASSGPPGPSAPLATLVAQAPAPARMAMPVAVIAVHGILATATILLVLLAAAGAA